ncbi:NAD-glutamate dehydrogenase [Temperatibacter marinus]|uniref:NAD-glutamate dehydrogenase n=1 Tax=Temperatibacter marinus TaxID=1456591 RepID=A0AA52EHM9_9PROT|nr:NAD-glutamate dehydrogenase [Temperatibacter marinus]WND03823.1 NAD-glutamate dehydrogenase [Temperatibacter marinus]
MITKKDFNAIIKSIKTVANKDLKKNEAEAIHPFIDAFYPPTSPDDLMRRSATELYAIAKDCFDAAQKRVKGESIVKVYNPPKDNNHGHNHSIVIIVNDDMPFLVDSISGGLTVTNRTHMHMMHHPIMDVPRSDKGAVIGDSSTSLVGKRPSEGSLRESVMYIEIDALSGKASLDSLQAFVASILKDVRSAVKDWRPMTAKIDETVAALTVNPPGGDMDAAEETIEFLRWLGADHFTFLGFRQYRFDGDPLTADFNAVEKTGLGILRDETRYVLRGQDGLTAMSPEIRHFFTSKDPLIITKANVKATVHRPTHLDYVGVKLFDESGNVVGENRFIGLFTSLSYGRSVKDVPILRQKVDHIQETARFDKSSHAGKALLHIMESYPRDEFFQISNEHLYENCLGILQLTERPRTQAFIRRDKFERFVSAIVYVPRDNYHSGLREKIAQILCEAFNGEVSVYYANLSSAALARWHFIIRTKPGEVLNPDEKAIDDAISDAARGWQDRLKLSLVEKAGEELGTILYREYKDRFSMGYRENFDPAQAAFDVLKLNELTDEDRIRFDFYRHRADGDDHFRLKIHHKNRMVPLSDCLPLLENLGFHVIGEHSYTMQDGSPACIHDFTLYKPGGIDIAIEDTKPIIEDLLLNTWQGRAENDAFNTLVMTSGMTWSEILVLRAYGKYLRQLGLGYTPEYISQCMVEHSKLSATLVSLFRTLFDPQTKGNREKQAKTIANGLMSELEKVSSLDQDRILRAYLSVMSATQRTNFFQPGVLEGVDERALAFKLKTREIEEAPLPRPYAEIWVYSPRVEGVHLRGGPVARGGLRWSDRREDFRTEILGLVKAQQVKNTVIVPQGAKGGFFAKQLPAPSDREAFMNEGVAAYRMFITSLISLTDNLIKGDLVPPSNTWRRDSDDPYLVVAADKGTATFSDIANGISEAHNFWLGDAFASGGSNGYDHKGMGITAKGAWISVQRHFRELGVNTQTDPIATIGVGDMAGDVFGNGMLLSKTIALKAAFNHLHIFVDPNPKNLEKTWDERKRLFEMPRSSWEDYNKKLISKGGGIFSRSEKSIPLSAEMKEWLGVKDDTMAPNQLIHTILKAEADLLWFGGIGTYIRASDETDAEVGDRANNAIRIVPDQLKIKVIGEGGNLGMTHKARIELSKLGGRLNADFIDNSAGVDCSDKEVNIKILLADVLENGKMNRDERDTLLVEMTDEVSDIVLTDNYLQTQAISVTEAYATEQRDSHAGLMRMLEREGLLNREIENLPSDDKLAEMEAQDKGLTRPEISTLMSYAKMSLYDVLLEGTIVDGAVLRDELEWSFPKVLREKFPDEISRHRLKRELVATVLCNEVVNWAGLTFVYDIKEETGLAVEDIVAAFVIVREIYELKTNWQQINDLDYKIDSGLQYEMHNEVSLFIRHQVLWLLRNLAQPFDIQDLIRRFATPVHNLFSEADNLLTPESKKLAAEKISHFKKQGVTDELARVMAGMDSFRQVPDINAVAEATRRDVKEVAVLYFSLGEAAGFNWLRNASYAVQTEDRWDVLSLRSVREDLADQQRELTRKVLESSGQNKPEEALSAWLDAQKTKIIRTERLVADLKASGAMGLSKLSFAVRHLRSILK